MQIKHISNDVQRVSKIFNLVQDKYWNGTWNQYFQSMIVSPSPNSHFGLFNALSKETSLRFMEIGRMIDMTAKYPHLLIEIYQEIEDREPYNIVITPIKFIKAEPKFNGIGRVNCSNYPSYLVE